MIDKKLVTDRTTPLKVFFNKKWQSLNFLIDTEQIILLAFIFSINSDLVLLEMERTFTRMFYEITVLPIQFPINDHSHHSHSNQSVEEGNVCQWWVKFHDNLHCGVRFTTKRISFMRFYLENSESFLPSTQKFLFLFCKHGLISEIYEQLVSAYSELCKTFKMELVTYLFLNADDFCLI